MTGQNPQAKQRPSDLSPLDAVVSANEPKVFVPTGLLDRVGHSNQALLLAQLLYYFGRQHARLAGHGEPRARAFHDRFRWAALSHERLSRETGLSVHQTKRALAALKKAELVYQEFDPTAKLRRMLLRPTQKLVREFCDEQHRGPLVHAAVVRMTGSVAAALVLSQILYYHGNGRGGMTRLRVKRRGKYWLAKTYRELARETGLTPRAVTSAIGRLKRLGLIFTDNWKFAGNRTLHSRINYDAFCRAWQQQDDERLKKQKPEPRQRSRRMLYLPEEMDAEEGSSGQPEDVAHSVAG